ncbi:D-erythronate dehydrogenase [Roseicyclus persicicus]|uniref:SDR family oxidoreductase n=1 Tax=Roseicyclus persicicus TaxID=2650661 RepID=A0A7X6JWS1_9RHOB|nr:D-erythronate dehydrogenase [Roseibacterium persicicum]NKX44757.1 SDR family oxidoreductase [Roseibacterium persicicum]
MHVLIIGAGGMIGAKLAARIAGDGALAGRALTRLDLVDIAAPPVPAGAGALAQSQAADLSDDGVAAALVARRPDVIFHLAAVVSGEAEADFEKGYRVNLDATRALFEAIRHAHLADGYRPRLVFTSSLAVYGAPLPDVIPDDHIRAPRTSYGVQKAIAELLIDDYTRRGFMDGIGLRLPTIVIRPGRPNAAASGFFSGILREPLAGQRSTLPVPETTRHWLASPRAAVGFLIHAAGLDGVAVGPRRTLTMPGVACSVGDQIAALERAAGPQAVALIDHAPDPAIAAIIDNWPRAFDPAAARALGFTAETTVDELIAVYRADDAPRG